MKRIVGLLILVGLLVIPCLAAGQTGIYVAPKFTYGTTKMGKFGIEGPGYSDGFMYNTRKSDIAVSGGLAIGYDFHKQARVPVRLEVEYSRFSKVIGEEKMFNSIYTYYLVSSLGEDECFQGIKQTLKIQTFFVNAYYDFRNDMPVSFWLGAGVGMAFIDHKGEATTHVPGGNINLGGVPYWDFVAAGSKKTKNVGWHAGAGVAYDFTKALSLDIGYRFSSLGGATTKDCVDPLFGTLHHGKIKNIFMHQLILGLRLSF